ncbi:sec23-binding domain of sec16 domain-containing protein [Phthorimaea operculella]|nr:sec23-binding domain of sec16 domain-containing protein [Phthorimaea operculella]
MSWPQRAGAAPAHPPPQPQRPGPGAQHPQGYNNQQNMYQNYQGAQPPPGNTQQYWAGQQPQFNQQYGQVYQQQDYGNNANQFYQQTPQYNQNYASQGYTDTQQQYPQSYYPNQATQQQGYQAQPKTDSWEDNWDWGWDEASKQAQQGTMPNQAAAPPAQPQQQQVYNNANVIEESFASTDTWNWSMEDKKEAKDVPAPKQDPAVLPTEKPVENQSVNQHPPRSSSNASSHGPAEEVRSLSDREVVKERLPNLALGKRIHLENLTPQWSIESQMSQESSDGPQTHSEGTYRSDNQSRNSSKSSPGVNTENSNFNYPQSTEDYTPSTEWSRHSNEDTLVDNNQSGSRRESHDELANSLRDMNIANRENPAPEQTLPTRESVQPPPSISPANLPPPVSSFMPPPTMPLPTMPPAPPVTAGAGLPPPTSSAILPPPTNFPPSSSSTNPFKQSGPFSHKKVPSASPSLQSFPPTSSTNLTSPNVVNKVSQSQHRVPVGFGANLETTPDNSERPDQPQMSAFRPAPIPQQVPDNLEVAPQNDRNEYLQTAHLSSSDYGENTDFSRNVPPPGLRRMVVGQQESEYGQSLNISGDEPPPGLARMVPGQQTEADNSYNQAENYMERHVDGQLTDSGRPYRQADGQQTPENYSQPPSRGSDRRPIGLDRMVPGEPSNDEYPQYQAGNYSASSSEHRVVTGVDHDYPMPTDAGPTDIREQNVDGSDYSEQTPRAVQRNVIGARDVSNDVTQDYSALPEDQQREITMEGENLQDLSIIPAPDMSYSREQTFDGADNATDGGIDRKTDLSDSIEHPTTSSRRQSLNRGTSGEESDRDRAFKSSPRRDRDKHKSTRDRDRDRERDKEGGRYSRGDRKFDRDREDRRSGRDKDRPDKDWDRREESPHSRRHRRGTRSRRYETEDTDYYSDRERERRAYREGSYASKPPRPDESRRHDRSRRERHRDDRDRYEGRYRDIDPTRKHGNLRAEREDEERRRGELYSSASRPDSRDGPGATATDEDLNDTLASESRRRDRRRREPRPDPYYDSHYAAAGYPDAYSMQRQQYEYYERLRATDPHAYLQLYKQIMAGRAPVVPTAGQPAYAGMYGYEPRVEDRGSVHSGRSSTNGLKGNDTYYGAALGIARTDLSSLRGVPSLRTDVSDRELNTDASLNLHLEESTVRSERMTPFKFSTAHVKGDISSRNVVVVRPSYPVDGLPATVHIMSLASALARDPMAQELAAYPGPLIKVVVRPSYPVDGLPATVHIMSLASALARDPMAQELAAYPGPLIKVVPGGWVTGHRANYVTRQCLGKRPHGAGTSCLPWTSDQSRGRGTRDHIGYVLVWELLALLLRQNGVVVGTDIAELLMKNKKEYEYKTTSPKNSTHNDSRRGSSLSGQDERAWSPDQPSLSTSDLTPQDETISPSQQAVDEKAALDKLREYLTYGNRQEALEWAMSCGLWGHAMQLAVCMERRARANVAARFLAALSRTDPLHTLYSHLQARQPPAATARQPPAATVRYHSGCHVVCSHAMQLAVCMERRARANVAARFLAALSRTDPLHTLYSHLQARQPPAATCVTDERWGDWRPHAAIMLANTSVKPEQDRRTLTQLGDSLLSRGLLYSAQFCYVSAGVGFSRHPLAPLQPPATGSTAQPRLALLMGDARATTLAQLATNQAIFATEIYEYALSLNQDYIINELQVYKLLLATRLIDVGQYERALGYTEAAAKAVTRDPRAYSPRLIHQLADIADRLKYHEPALQEDPPLVDEGSGSGEPSPRHHQQWLDDVKSVAQMLTAEREASVSAHTTPQHNFYAPPAQTAWGEQTQQQEYQPPQPQTYEPEETQDYSQYYQQQPPPPPTIPEQPQTTAAQDTTQNYEEWGRQEDTTQQQGYDNTYWQGDGLYSYGERGGSARGTPRPAPRNTPAASAALPAGGEPPGHPAPATSASTLRRRAVHPTPEPPTAAFLPRRAPPQPPVQRLRSISRSSADSSGSERARRPVSSSSPRPPISDLDIQIAHSPQLGMPTPAGPLIPPAPRRNKRCGSLIGNTVDSWARSTVTVRDGTYKPLVFGGTYPIEVPASPPEVQRPLGVKPPSQVAAVKPRQLTEVHATLDPKTHRQELRKTIERSLDRFEAILARREMSKDARRQAFSKRVVNTFDIDEPMTSTDPPKESMLKEKDAKYYVSGPKTFNIDEPASNDEQRPQITMPGTVTMPGAAKQRNVYGDYEDERAPSPEITMPGTVTMPGAAKQRNVYGDYEDESSQPRGKYK